MELGMVGLGRMGGNMTRRLLQKGHRVVVFDFSQEAVSAAASEGAAPSSSLEDMVSQLSAPRAVWVMVPAGDPTEQTINAVVELLSPGDSIIDGGNSNYHETQRRAAAVAEKGVTMLDCGTSGGIWGLTEGYSLMVGGDADAYARLEPIFQALAPSETQGLGHVGPAGSGHYVKMIHNGIEYAMMQAFAEGFEILKAKEEFDLDLHGVGQIWQHGSVVRSWLLDLAVSALDKDPGLDEIMGHVSDSGEGRWTIQEAIDLDVPAHVITTSLFTRFRSRMSNTFADRMLAALRNEFGGHAVVRSDS